MIAVPLAIVLAHHRKGELAAAWVINVGRAIPTVTILGLLVIVSLRNGFGLEPWPIIIALVLLGLPPAFTNTYAGVRGVDAGAVGAARAMGLTHRQVMQRVELALAVPGDHGGRPHRRHPDRRHRAAGRLLRLRGPRRLPPGRAAAGATS